MKTDGKVATAEEVLVAKGENLVANATDTVAMLSPALTYYFWNTVGRGIRSLFKASQWHKLNEDGKINNDYHLFIIYDE